MPHAPQLLESVLMFTHDPLQLVRPEPQTVVHAEFEQTWPPVQACPHDPQFATSDASATQAPEQFVWPLVHTTVHCPPTQLCPGGQA
jgi:hypothetical protein